MCLAIHSNPEVQNILPHLIRDYIFLSLFFDWIFNFWKIHSIFAFQNLCFTYLSIRNILLSRKLRLALKTLSLKFSFSVFLFFNISFESEFGNPLFETLEKQNVFNFQLTFSAIVDLVVDFILWFCRTHSSKTCSFELISQLLLFYDEQQKKFSNPAFKNWYWSNLKNAIFWFTVTGPLL